MTGDLKSMRKVLLGLLFGVVLTGLAAAGAYRLWRSTGEEGGGDLEQWLGHQVVRILETYITPTVEFETIDFQAPKTVILGGLSLTAEGQSMIAVERLLLELAEIPRFGEPIVIERIELRAPRIRFVRSLSGGFIGWSTFVRRKERDAQEVPAEVRLSNVLRMRRISIEAGQIVFDANDGTDPMVLRGIDTVLNTPPDSSDPAWHALDGRIKRDDLFLFTFAGRVNLDVGMIECHALKLTGTLGEAQYELFPPGVQSILRRHQARGEISVELAGDFSVGAWSQARVEGKVKLIDARAVFGEAVLPVKRLELELELVNERLKVEFDADLLEGHVSGTGTAALSGDRSARMECRMNDVSLDAAFESVSGKPAKYSGRVHSEGAFLMRLDALPQSIGGGGSILIDEGRMVQLPLVKALSRLMITHIPGMESRARDRLAVDFLFHPEYVRVESMELTTSVLKAKGDGRVYYNGDLNLEIRAGLVNRLGKQLGPLGSILGALTENFVTYVVRGEVGNPEVTVSPLGFGSR